jgi:hypothetical protein
MTQKEETKNLRWVDSLPRSTSYIALLPNCSSCKNISCEYKLSCGNIVHYNCILYKGSKGDLM